MLSGLCLLIAFTVIQFRACGTSNKYERRDRLTSDVQTRVFNGTTKANADLFSGSILSRWWVADSDINDIVYAPSLGKVYIAGSFTYLGRQTGAGVILDPNTRLRPAELVDLQQIAGTVTAAIPDGARGYYIGGGFTQVGDVSRKCLAHILSDGSLDSAFDAQIVGTAVQINAIVKSGAYLYIGGQFTSVGGQPRSGIAKIDAATGQIVSSWNTNGISYVSAIAVSGTSVFVGGSFSKVGDQARKNLAEVDSETGSVLAWNPDPNNSVNSLAVDGNSLYIGGAFTSIGGESRTRLAKIDLATPRTVTSWNPAPNRPVYRIVAASPFVYVGGSFSSIAGNTSKGCVARFDTSTGNEDTGWNPNVASCTDESKYVQTIFPSGSDVFIGGSFSAVAGQPRYGFAQIDATSGAATSWAPRPVGSSTYGVSSPSVKVVAANDRTIFIGGTFLSFSPEEMARNRIAEIDATTFDLTDWNPHPIDNTARQSITHLTLTGSSLFAAEKYETPAPTKLTKYRVIKFNLSTGQLTNWSPNWNSADPISALSMANMHLYVATGAYGGQLHEINTITGEAVSWTPNYLANKPIYAINVSNGIITIGGDFTVADSDYIRKDRLARLSASTHELLTDGYLGADNTVRTLVLGGSFPRPGPLYVGGDFGTVVGQTRNRIAKFSMPAPGAPSTAPIQLEEWNPNIGSTYITPKILTIALSPSFAYVGGSFNTVGSSARISIAAIDATTGEAIEWAPNLPPLNVPSQIKKLVLSCDSLFVAGGFMYNPATPTIPKQGATNYFFGITEPATDPQLNCNLTPTPTPRPTVTPIIEDFPLDY